MNARSFFMATSVVLLVACGGGGGDSDQPVTSISAGPLDKYVGTYSYCDQDHTALSLAMSKAEGNNLNVIPKEITYQNANCTGSVLATYTWSGPAKASYIATGISTISGGGLPSSLEIDRVQISVAGVSIVLSGSGVSANCVAYPKGRFCYAQLLASETTQGGFYLKEDKFYELVLSNGIYKVDGVYSRN